MDLQPEELQFLSLTDIIKESTSIPKLSPRTFYLITLTLIFPISFAILVHSLFTHPVLSRLQDTDLPLNSSLINGCCFSSSSLYTWFSCSYSPSSPPPPSYSPSHQQSSVVAQQQSIGRSRFTSIRDIFQLSYLGTFARRGHDADGPVNVYYLMELSRRNDPEAVIKIFEFHPSLHCSPTAVAEYVKALVKSIDFSSARYILSV